MDAETEDKLKRILTEIENDLESRGVMTPDVLRYLHNLNGGIREPLVLQMVKQLLGRVCYRQHEKSFQEGKDSVTQKP